MTIVRAICLLFFMVACSQQPTVTPIPSATNTTEWTAIADGMQRQLLSLDRTLFQTIQIDPQVYTFRVFYHPQSPKTIRQWQAELPAATLIINANFFSPENTALGLLVSDSIHYSHAYNNRGGIFYVTSSDVGIYSTLNQSYQGAPLQQAIQAFPMLMIAGEAAYSDSNPSRPARRTIIAENQDGHIIIMATPGFGITLHTLSQELAESNLNIVNALNLDGGGSTMMYVANGNDDIWIRAFDPVPTVLAVFPRDLSEP